ncbi:phospholipase D-like domain-containing anti-phage protein [Accumulibacter sp.]|uniref:phospholipase D-like domain-containing anti-phage protein n=1 Tax=Accumulibacter sp. TaxID=2053492 RepID=UPI0025D58D83|nr:phospholipase D-like domain-containing anti-phage protein [Accumulibacter sp.]MCM8612465.1 phospholipase D-like domain-containing protein [Accumulibacter sp.]MCM8636862.1 phospholipase D-like domain-containing protein [Accumulibacter sp.]MCM8640538.1 phospholipase D-like domain-containing protein [Accumulibacter sp.]
MTIKRLSSRRQPLGRNFLNDRLVGAVAYDRIAGYFRSSVFEIAGEAFEAVAGPVRIVCNSGLDEADIATARAAERAIRTEWCDAKPEYMTEPQRPRYERLRELLRAGRVEVRVLPNAAFGLIHGKAGVIAYADGRRTSFLGSINETAEAWTQHYELVWEDDAPDAVAWVEEEFAALWNHRDARRLSDAIVEDVERILSRNVVAVSRWTPAGKEPAPFIEAPIARQGAGLAPHQQAFVSQVAREIGAFGQARYLLADDVGLGKTLQLGMAAQYVALTSEKPVLILAPKNLLQQWQDELRNMLAAPSARWDRGRWITEDGAVWPAAADACPRRIGIFPTSLITARSPAAEPLTALRYGCIVLDEAHRARQSGGLGNDRGPNNLLDFMLRIAERTETLLLGTATPIQTDRAELYDLMRILNGGCGRVLGGYGSPWRSRDDAMDMVAGRAPIPETPATCWAWLRDPLIPRGEHRTASRIRDELGAAEAMTGATVPAIDGFSSALRSQITFDAETLIRHHNPFVRHTIKRRRKDLKAPDGTSYFPEIGIRLHGETEDDALEMPDSMAAAYQDAREFCQRLARSRRGAGLFKTLLLRRIGSSLVAGLSTAEKLLQPTVPEGDLFAEEDAEPGEATAPDETALQADASAYDVLRRAIDRMRAVGNSDPKLLAAVHYLRDKGWAERGCILFSQYYDTVWWLATQIADTFRAVPVGVYAGLGHTYVLRGDEVQRAERTDIEGMVKRRQLRLLVATDAASEGLNLQRLQTLINIDLPWNPSRLEQRKGRIERIGQEAEVIDILNLRYRGSVEDDVHRALAHRLKDIRDVFGTLPDTLEDVWVLAAEGELEQAKSRIDSVPRQHPFLLRYTESVPATDWNRCEQVLNRADMVEYLKCSWARRGGNARSAAAAGAPR